MLKISVEENYDEDDDDDDEEFHYPGSSPIDVVRTPSVRSMGTDYFTRSSTPRTLTDLTPHLSQAPDFRVPTHEAPQKVLTPRWTPPTPHQIHAQWERDETVTQCRECRRRFGLLTRRVSLYPRVITWYTNVFLTACKQPYRFCEVLLSNFGDF